MSVASSVSTQIYMYGKTHKSSNALQSMDSTSFNYIFASTDSTKQIEINIHFSVAEKHLRGIKEE